MLLFKKRFLPAIRAGSKTQTIRLWPHRRMRTGQRSYIPGAGYIHVELVETVVLDDLTDADAVADGFDSAEQLRAELRNIYADQFDAGHETYRVCFRLMTPEEVYQETGKRV